MGSILEALQSNEEARIRCFRACLRKNVVFETSLIANRGYDMRGMAEVMENIDVEMVVRKFIEKHTSNSTSSALSHPEANDVSSIDFTHTHTHTHTHTMRCRMCRLV